MSSPYWIVNKDYTEDPKGEAVEVEGPSGCEPQYTTIIFKMEDDDDNLYYTGTMNGDALDAFGGPGCPLYDYGMPNAGACHLYIYRNREWEEV